MNTTFQNKTLDPMLLTRPTQRCFAKLASGLLALSLLLGARAGAGAAQVATDQPDYAPGSTAIITGTGFAAGETVTLQVLHADGTLSTGDDHLPWTVLADPDGAFVTTWHVCEDDCVGSTLRLTAVGQTSGQTAEAFFTDSVFLINMNAPVPVSGGCMRLVPNPPPPLPTTSVQGFLQAGHTYQFSFTATTSGSPPPCFLVNPPSITFSLDPGFGSLTFTAVRVGLTTTYTNRVTIPAGACGSSLITFTCDGGSTRQVMASGFPLELVASFDCFNTIACQHPPTVSCPPPTVIPCTSDAGATATVTVGIGDADNDPLTVSWLVDGGLVSSPPVAPGATTASLVNYPFGFGPHTVKAIVSDGNSQPVTCETMVTVTAHDAPVPSLATLPTITVECSATIAERPTATDVCAAGGIVFGVTTDPPR